VAGTYQVGFYAGCGTSGDYAPNWYDNQPSETTASPITLTTSQVFDTADAVLQPAATITGKITNTAGNALSGVCVDATTPLDAELGPVAGASAQSRKGTYTSSGLSPGQYLVNFGCGYGGGTPVSGSPAHRMPRLPSWCRLRPARRPGSTRY